jgi:hypothetical protein
MMQNRIKVVAFNLLTPELPGPIKQPPGLGQTQSERLMFQGSIRKITGIFGNA